MDLARFETPATMARVLLVSMGVPAVRQGRHPGVADDSKKKGEGWEMTQSHDAVARQKGER